MYRISDWFDRHMKTRIVVQLVLDAAPVMLLVYPFGLGIMQLEGVSFAGWMENLAVGCMYTMLLGGGALLFVLAIWMHGRSRIAFECYPVYNVVSGMLRVLSAISAVISFGCFVGAVYTWLKNM